MAESFLITLREGFEAALIVAIVLAAAKRGSRPELARWVWGGTAAATVLAAAVGLVLHLTLDGLTGPARSNTFAAICLTAAGLLTWMIFWMRTHARSLKGELEQKTANAVGQSGVALAVVAFAAVAREGLETSLFLLSSTSAANGIDVLLGGTLGLIGALVLGVLIYKGSQRVPMRRFFQVTGILIIVFAAGLASRAVLFLQVSGVLRSWNLSVVDLTQYAWLTLSTQTGRFLAGIFGWDPRPSIEQVVAYVGYLVPVLVLFLRPARTVGAKPQPTAPAVQEPVSVT